MLTEQSRLEKNVANTRWTPLFRIETKPGAEALWRMRCKCGTERDVWYKNYARGLSLSCGCYREALARNQRGNNRLPLGESARNQLLLVYRRGAAKRGFTWSLDRERFLALTSSPCHYCGDPPRQVMDRAKYIGKGNGAYIYSGIDRVDSTRGYEPGNCVPCCRACNYAKSNRSHADFIAWLDRLVWFRSPKPLESKQC